VNLNKSLADNLNQPTSFLTARSNKKKSEIPNEAQNPLKPENPCFSEPCPQVLICTSKNLPISAVKWAAGVEEQTKQKLMLMVYGDVASDDNE